MSGIDRLSALLAASFVITAVLSGCSHPLAEMISSAPNRFNPMVDVSTPWPTAEEIAGADESFQVEVGPPRATISVAVLEPMKEYKQPKGTVLVLHGIFMRGVWMMPQANMLATCGYRAVLVDLRGHGRSSGERLSFGVQEAKDLSQIIDELERRDLIAGEIGVYGFSYGAAAAIHLAGLDPRIKAVVAVAPFSDIRDEIPHFGRIMFPGAGWAVPDDVYQQAVDEAGRMGRFDPDIDTAIEAIKQTEAQVLLVHGRGDFVVPHDHSVHLHEAAPKKSELLSVPWAGHVAVWADPTGSIIRNSLKWFDSRLAGQ